jgi:ATP-dependent helicase/nuclease subunit A
MTVHGAKGLESPIVILPDTMERRDPNEANVLLHDGLAWWWLPKAEQPPLYADMRAATLAARQAERDRLLYVAMTRAEKWLILAGAGNVKEDSDGWFARLSQVMAESGAQPVQHGFGIGLRLESVGWNDLPLARSGSFQSDTPVILPGWTQSHAPAAPPQAKPVSPSALGGAKALPGEGLDEATAKSYGALVHLLLDNPQADPANFRLPPELTTAALAEAQATRHNPGLAFLFGPDVLSEQPFSVTLPGLGRVYGIIDRLVLRPGSVLAVDFKTNRALPADAAAVPEGLLRQMGAYAAALAALYPDRRVETALVWTRSGQIMPLPHDLVTAALQRAASLDGARAAP